MLTGLLLVAFSIFCFHTAFTMQKRIEHKAIIHNAILSDGMRKAVAAHLKQNN